MTARLRESLHGAAGDVPAYPVYERALATARRSRRRTGFAIAAVLVLVALAGAVPPLVDTVAPAAAGADAALPDRVGVPPLGSLHATDRPRLGPASVIFTGQGHELEYGMGGSLITVVGARTIATGSSGAGSRSGPAWTRCCPPTVARSPSALTSPRIPPCGSLTWRPDAAATWAAGSPARTWSNPWPGRRMAGRSLSGTPCRSIPSALATGTC